MERPTVLGTIAILAIFIMCAMIGYMIVAIGFGWEHATATITVIEKAPSTSGGGYILADVDRGTFTVPKVYYAPIRTYLPLKIGSRYVVQTASNDMMYNFPVLGPMSVHDNIDSIVSTGA